MGTICEIILDLGNGQSGLKGIFDKISKRTSFALSQMDYEGIIIPGDYGYFSDKRGIITFERHFFCSYYLIKCINITNNSPKKIVEKLLDNLLEVVDRSESHDLLNIKRTIGICSSALLELRHWIIQFNFTVKNNEIYFFKVTKPSVLSEYHIYSKLTEIEAQKPVTSIKTSKKCLKRIISNVQFFFDENSEFYHYYRIGSEHLDDKYFARTNKMRFLNLFLHL